MHTFSNLRFVFTSRLELLKTVDHGENLHSTYCRQQMGVMARGGSKASILVLTRENKVDSVLPWERFGMAKKM